MVQKARVTAFTISELLRDPFPPTPPNKKERNIRVNK